MIITTACFSMALQSDQSTYATTYEKTEIREVVDNEWYRAASQIGHTAPLLVKHMNVESLSEYQSPGPIRFYDVKIRISSRTKGLPENYNEQFEDMS